ncbi:AMP-binding protein [Mycolicibacterium vaccae]|uniref:AMP-binding protein n=1 Tax=Mycolicibacterium vaccae TaxID=1810 RepID=UPI003CFB7691
MAHSSVTDVLRERASLHPDDTAFTYMNYDIDWEGVAETLTWGQLYRRVCNFAQELTAHAAPGERVVVLLPQSLDYIVAFLGSLQANMVAVPLSVPAQGRHDERVTAVLRDAAPTVVVTTADLADDVNHLVAQDMSREADGVDRSIPAVLLVDTLDLDSSRRQRRPRRAAQTTAYLQYTSGSTRTPAGVMVTHRNLMANFEQIMAGFFPGSVAPPDATAVTWLPFYHDMGLMLGVCAPILAGWHTVFTSPASFLVRPARWVKLLGTNPSAITAAPNFAFELAAAKTTDDDLEGIDLSGIECVLSGSERVHPTTLGRFADRFGPFGLQHTMLRPCYGLAEATLFVATQEPGLPPRLVHFEPAQLAAGHAQPCEDGAGTALVSYGTPKSPEVRIVDPQTRRECVDGTLGEIWIRGDNVCAGYWENPEYTDATFRAQMIDASADTVTESWLRTGDLGFMSDGEFFIVGRIKDTIIVRGRNHYPDDIEVTVGEITGGRAAAVLKEQEGTEELVVIAEVKTRGQVDDEGLDRLRAVHTAITSALSNKHGLRAADLLLVPRGSLPTTTSGKIRRSTSAEMYVRGEFTPLIPG